MEGEGVPSDATTLIYLAKADSFSLVEQAGFTLSCPAAVWREAVEDGEAGAYEDVQSIRDAEATGWVRRVSLTRAQEATASAIATTHRVGQGESEVLALAASGGRALLDDGRAARVAESIGVMPISTLFLPAIAAARGSLSHAAAIEALRAIARAAGARAEAIIEVERFIGGESR
jgi:predicted nucleic acid-binding protein